MYVHRINSLFGVSLFVHALGAPDDWSPAKPENRDRIAAKFRDFSIGGPVYCPTPVGNAQVCDTSQLSPVEDLPQMYRGVNAGGVILSPGSSYYLASGDCPTVVLYDPDSRRAACLHAGRDEVLDSIYLETGSLGRQYFSIAEAGVMALDVQRTSQLKVFVGYGIAPEDFSHPTDHPVYGMKNQQLITYLARHHPTTLVGDPSKGCIDIRQLLHEQFMNLGIPGDNIRTDMVNTFADQDEAGNQWHSCRRGDKTRNGIIVVYR